MGLSINHDAVKRRIAKLPSMVNQMAETSVHGQALRLIEIYREGLEGNTFPLPRLKRKTVKRKAALGYTKPENPLRALGMDGTNTLASSLRAWKTGNGWVVRMPKRSHSSGRIELDKLLAIHENGAIIRKSDGTVFRIPSRPVFAMSYAQLMKELKERDPAAEVTQAVNEMLTKGKDGRQRTILNRIRRYEAKYG